MIFRTNGLTIPLFGAKDLTRNSNFSAENGCSSCHLTVKSLPETDVGKQLWARYFPLEHMLEIKDKNTPGWGVDGSMFEPIRFRSRRASQILETLLILIPLTD